jgi:hypothetical protein
MLGEEREEPRCGNRKIRHFYRRKNLDFTGFCDSATCQFVKDYNTVPAYGDQAGCIKCRIGILEFKYSEISGQELQVI